MSRLSPFHLLAASGMLALAAACLSDSQAARRHPKFSHEVKLEPGHPEIAISLELAAALRLILPDPAAGSGYAWEIVSNNTRVLEQTTGLRTTTVSFYSLLPGKSVIRFALVRPGDRDAVPAAHFEVVVVVREPD